MTIKEIAKIAGVSKSTISRVLTGSSEVNKETKEKVLRIIEEYNYVPNRFAIGLSTAKSSVIGVIVPDIKNMFYVEVIDQLEINLQNSGYTMFLCNARGKNSYLEYYFGLLNSLRAEGVFYISPSTEKINFDSINHIPMITIDGKIDDAVPSVICKHRDGIKLALNALIEQNCKNILYITGLDYFYSVVNKNKGYEQIIEQDNDFAINKIETNLDSEDNYRIIKAAIEQDKTIDGIACINDELAFITIRVLRELGLQISKDLFLVGYDDSNYISTLAPELSSIRIPIDEMAKSAVEMMVQKLENNQEVKSKMFDLELIKRSSLERK